MTFSTIKSSPKINNIKNRRNNKQVNLKALAQDQSSIANKLDTKYK